MIEKIEVIDDMLQHYHRDNDKPIYYKDSKCLNLLIDSMFEWACINSVFLTTGEPLEGVMYHDAKEELEIVIKSLKESNVPNMNLRGFLPLLFDTDVIM